MSYEQDLRIWALENAIKYKGKTNPKALVGKVIGAYPDKKSNMKELIQDLNTITNEINSLSLQDQEKEYATYGITKEKPKEKTLKELPNVSREVHMRLAPSPSGPLHIGHAYVLALNYEYVKKYGGKLFVRIEDTNPDNIYEPAYEQIPEDAHWLCENNISEVIIQSDRMEEYYLYGKQLLHKEKMYVCSCKPDDFKQRITKSIACPCRELGKDEQLKRWRMMHDGTYAQGEAVCRFKSDIKHKNPAMRDFPLFRINESEHPRQGKKFRVWPLMNMGVAVDDMLLGMTHCLRGKDHADNAKRQAMIHEVLGSKTPEAISVGRINFAGGLPVSCSKTRPRIEAGEFNGWDDIRLPFLRALKRRGIRPEALRKYAVEIGVTKNDKTVAMDDYFKSIYAFNQDLIDDSTKRLFFVNNPVEILIKDAPSFDTELDFHPDHMKGGRKFSVNGKFFIAKKDYDDIMKMKDGELIRLMDCLNFVRKGEQLEFHSREYAKFKGKGKRIIHWLPKDECVDASVLLLDGNMVKGKAEARINDLDVNDVIQFERFGFVRLDEKNNFWFTH